MYAADIFCVYSSCFIVTYNSITYAPKEAEHS